ncbi:MAG: hypothetical protein N2B06_17515 [Clostridium sp.]
MKMISNVATKRRLIETTRKICYLYVYVYLYILNVKLYPCGVSMNESERNKSESAWKRIDYKKIHPFDHG